MAYSPILNPHPVTVGTNSLVSTANSTAVNLAAAAVFTGTSEDVSEYSTIAVTVFSSHASATDGLSVQQSSNNTDWDNADVYSIPAATGKIFSFGVSARFYRLVYTNGATLTTSLRIQTLFSKNAKKSSSVRPQDGRGNDNDFEEVSAFGHLYNGTSWDRARGTIANGLAVDVTRLSALVAGSALIGVVRNGDGTNNAAIKPASTAAVFSDPAMTVAVRPGGALVTTSAALADAVTNPSIGLQAALISAFNGTTWDRMRGTIANGLLTDVSRIVAALPTGANTIGAVTGPAAAPLALDATSTNHTQRLQSTTLAVTVTALANTAATATLPAVAAQFHYITGIEIMRTSTAALAGTATLVVTSTNLPGALAWSFGNAMAAGATQRDLFITFPNPIKSSVANTATTVVMPAPGAAVLWRANVYYYTAA